MKEKDFKLTDIVFGRAALYLLDEKDAISPAELIEQLGLMAAQSEDAREKYACQQAIIRIVNYVGNKENV